MRSHLEGGGIRLSEQQRSVPYFVRNRLDKNPSQHYTIKEPLPRGIFMKYILFTLSFLVTVPACAYQAGPANRANFGSSPQTQQQTGYRSFSNYNSRWNQGVPNQPVQTSLAGSSVKEFDAPAKQPVGKQAVSQPAAKGGSSVAAAAPAAAPTQASSAPVAMPANMDPSAMMQQVQGMMQSMQSMPGGTPAAGGQAGAAAMPAMPDMSALMNGMMNPGAAPAATPAKK